MKKQATRTTIIIVCMILLVVGYYAYVSNRSREQKDEAKMTAVEKVLSRDLAKDYPATPKEVLKYYNEIMKCFYNEECTEDEIDELGYQARELYDEDLLAHNELGTYLMQLHSEIEAYKESNRRITGSTVAASTSVDYYEVDGYSFARILCRYNLSEGGLVQTVNTVYLLRKDADNRWKIYGWDAEANVNFGEEAKVDGTE